MFNNDVLLYNYVSYINFIIKLYLYVLIFVWVFTAVIFSKCYENKSMHTYDQLFIIKHIETWQEKEK